MRPQYSNRQKTSPSPLSSSEIPLDTIYIHMFNMHLRASKTPTYIFIFKWHLSILKLLLLLWLFHAMEKSESYFSFFYSSFAPFHPCTMTPFLTLAHLPNRKLQATHWCIKSFLNILVSNENCGLYCLTIPSTVVDYQLDRFTHSRKFHTAVFLSESHTCLGTNKYIFSNDYEHTFSISNIRL